MASKAVKEFEVHPYVQFMLDKYSPYRKWIESEGVPIIGGAFFIVLQEKVSSYVQWYNIVVGLVLVLIVLFVPRGLVGLRDALRGRSGREAAG